MHLVAPFTIAAGKLGPQPTATALGEAGIDAHYWGFSLRDANSSSPVVRIRDAGAVGGKIIDTIAFNAGQSVREFYPEPVFAVGGVFVELVSGSMPEGTLRIS